MVKNYIKIYFPIVVMLFFLQFFSEKRIVLFINYLFYFFAFISLLQIIKTRRTITNSYPDYYRDFINFRIRRGSEPLSYRYLNLVKKTKWNAVRMASRYLNLAILIIFLSVISYFNWFSIHFNWLAFGVFLYMTSEFIVEKVTQPSVALFLAASNQESYELYRSIYMSFLPGKTTCLLDLPQNNNPINSVLRNESLRTQDDNLWKETVIELYKMCKIIIVDTRNDSTALQSELENINHLNLWNKTLIVGYFRNKDLAMINFLAKNPNVDQEKISFMGLSISFYDSLKKIIAEKKL
jgi:hypothetical protein